MFYGSGAGKLPTASAVVGDIVDEAKSGSRNVMASWSEEKLDLSDIKTSRKKFFVRVYGELEKELEKIEAIFGPVEPIVLEELAGEFGFVTEEMTEAEFEEKERKYGTLISRIRIRNL